MSNQPSIHKAQLKDFSADIGNANLHTELGEKMLAKAISQRGIARPILATSDGVIIAGDLTKKTIEEAGYQEALVIETDGTIPIIHVRKDLPDSSDLKARTLAIEDNRIAQVSLNWDGDKLMQAEVAGVQLHKLFKQSELAAIVIPEADTDAGKAEINTTLSSAKSTPVLKFGKYALGLIQEEANRLMKFLVAYQEKNGSLHGAIAALIERANHIPNPNPALAEMAAAQVEQESGGEYTSSEEEDEIGFDEDDEELYVEGDENE